MTRYGKKHWEDELDDMKAYRVERKYRGHKLAVAVGHNKTVRTTDDNAKKRSLPSSP